MSKTTTLTMVDGVRVVVPDVLDQITPYVLREQEDWFEDEIRFLRCLLQPGEQVIDIGANHGVYTLSMAKTVGPSGQVWAFEPATSTAQTLAASIEANGFRNVILDRSALSHHVGTGTLSLQSSSELNALVGEGATEGRSEAVPLTTLDECMRRFAWNNIDFIKIDAEGEEANILKGGERFFTELSPLVQFEIKAGATLHLDLVNHFNAAGYRSYRLVPGLDMLVPFDTSIPADDYLLNLFACKPDRAVRLVARGHLLPAVRAVSDLAKREFPTAADAKGSALPDWRTTIYRMPYAAGLRPAWEKAMEAGPSGQVAHALSHYVLSTDPSRSPAERFQALRASVELFATCSSLQPSRLRLASLARAAREFGARAVAVNALQQLCNQVLQTKQVDLGEPFLVPSARFDALIPVEPVANWVLAAAFEQWEQLAGFSSFYSPDSSRQRLGIIASLGLVSPEMQRRQQLLQALSKAADPVPSPLTTGNAATKVWSLLELLPAQNELHFDVLDIGAAINERPPYQSLVDARRARVIGFEPNVAECERLNQGYGAPHCFFPHFVGDGKPATFHETNWALTGSLLEPNSPLLQKFQNLAELVTPVASHAVTTVRIDDISEIENVDFFKIDVQGGELAVFRSALRALASALVVQTEVEFVELYRGQPLFADVDTFLRAKGFQFHSFQSISGRTFKPLLLNNDPNAAIGQALWADAIYVRDWMRLDDLSAVKLCKYAVLAHDVLRAYDLAHFVLEALDRVSGGGGLARSYLARLTLPSIPVPK